MWIGGASSELKLYDLYGCLHHTVSITCVDMYFCIYNNQVVYSSIITQWKWHRYYGYGVHYRGLEAIYIALQALRIFGFIFYGDSIKEIHYLNKGQKLSTTCLQFIGKLNEWFEYKLCIFYIYIWDLIFFIINSIPT